jgi:hypothetical protein
MRDIDAHCLEIAVSVLTVTGDLHASRLEQHVAGRAALVIDTFMTMRLVEAVSLMIASSIDNAGVEEMLGPLLDVFGDATDIWDRLDEGYRRRLNEIERRALKLIATGLPDDSPF